MLKRETTDLPSRAKENRRGSENFFVEALPDSINAADQDAAVAQIRCPKFGIAAVVPVVRKHGGLVPQAGWLVIGAAFGGDARRRCKLPIDGLFDSENPAYRLLRYLPFLLFKKNRPDPIKRMVCLNFGKK